MTINHSLTSLNMKWPCICCMSSNNLQSLLITVAALLLWYNVFHDSTSHKLFGIT
jgi:hypothetical protein